MTPVLPDTLRFPQTVTVSLEFAATHRFPILWAPFYLRAKAYPIEIAFSVPDFAGDRTCRPYTRRCNGGSSCPLSHPCGALSRRNGFTTPLNGNSGSATLVPAKTRRYPLPSSRSPVRFRRSLRAGRCRRSVPAPISESLSPQ